MGEKNRLWAVAVLAVLVIVLVVMEVVAYSCAKDAMRLALFMVPLSSLSRNTLNSLIRRKPYKPDLEHIFLWWFK